MDDEGLEACLSHKLVSLDTQIRCLRCQQILEIFISKRLETLPSSFPPHTKNSWVIFTESIRFLVSHNLKGINAVA